MAQVRRWVNMLLLFVVRPQTAAFCTDNSLEIGLGG